MAINPSITSRLTRWYLTNGMPHRLAYAILICQYQQAMQKEIMVNPTGDIVPIFDYPISKLRDDWRTARVFDLWIDSQTGEVVTTLPSSDDDLEIYHLHLPADTQAEILFGHFAYLFT